jgi:hypothetical protein
MITWTTSKEDTELMLAIVKRAESMGLVKDRMTVLMDITACHANGTPLRLADLLKAADFDFIHDITGITRYIDRESGQLTDCFLPRYAAPQQENETAADPRSGAKESK